MMRSALVIQGDIIIRKILERLVLSVGFSCSALSSLYDLDITELEKDYDVVITDILFDGVGPHDFAVHIREAIPLKYLLIVTNMGQDIIRKDMLSIEGVNGFFGVPFDLDEIEKQLFLL